MEPFSILVELCTKPATTETRMEDLQNTKTKLAYDGPIPMLGHAQRNQRHHTVEIPAYPCFCGTIHNSQVMESDKVPIINRRIKKM
jgi:hypothetical protein